MSAMAAGMAAAMLLTVSLVNAQTAQPSKAPKVVDKAPDNLSRAIRHQLLFLPFYSVFDNLTFSVEGRKVTLNGQVIRQTLKEHAETSVKSLEGVGIVVNNIEVLPQSASDDELRRDIYRAIFEDASLARYAIQAVPPIHIIVKNGSVVLVGTVDSDTDKALAGKKVGTVPNVSAVHNDLAVRIRDSPAN
jgi:hyperosmotically inducible periplasmic protein